MRSSAASDQHDADPAPPFAAGHTTRIALLLLLASVACAHSLRVERWSVADRQLEWTPDSHELRIWTPRSVNGMGPLLLVYAKPADGAESSRCFQGAWNVEWFPAAWSGKTDGLRLFVLCPVPDAPSTAGGAFRLDLQAASHRQEPRPFVLRRVNDTLSIARQGHPDVRVRMPGADLGPFNDHPELLAIPVILDLVGSRRSPYVLER